MKILVAPEGFPLPGNTCIPMSAYERGYVVVESPTGPFVVPLRTPEYWPWGECKEGAD